MLQITPLDAAEHMVPHELTDSTKQEYGSGCSPVTVPGEEAIPWPPVPIGVLVQVPPSAAQK